MKRIFTILFAAVLAGQAWAQNTFTSNGLKYTVTDETNHTVSVSDAGGSTRPPADLVIPSEVVYNNVTYYVTSLSNQAFWGTDNLKTVIIPNTVSSIGNEAFRSCSSLTAIIIPNSVTAISGGMFNGCGKLASISMSENIQTIGGYAFYGCKSLTSITLPETLTNISVNVFEGCTGLKILTVPSTVATIGGNAFKQVKKVVYAGPATGSWGCSNLIRGYYDGNFIYTDAEKTHVIEYYGTGSGVTVPNTVTTIADNAFKNSTGLTSITIPESVTEISPLAFVGCDVTLNVDGNANYAVADGVLFNADQTALIGCYQPLAGAYTIPNTVESIGSLAGCADLATIVIPASVATVGGGAFANCDNLEIYCEAESKPEGWDGNWNPDDRHVTWGVISCGDYILLPTSGTEHTVEVSNYIGSDASITIPESFEIGGVEYSVTKIGDYAFKSCSNLTSITIPVSVTEISPLAFAGCNVTLNVEENTNYSAEDGAIFNGDKTVLIGCYKPLTSYSIPSTVKTIELFSCPSLTSVSIPSSVENIGSAAFADCSSLTSVTTASNADYSNSGLYFISDGIKYKVLCIDSVEVVKHSYTGEVVVAASVTAGSKFNIVSIAPEAFKDCSGLTAIQIHINVKRVGADAFSGCNKLTSIVINSPADFSSAGLRFTKNELKYKVLTQDNVMFDTHNHAASVNVVIPETVTFGNTFTVTGIGYEALSGDSDLRSVIIPNTVTFIENSAFDCCTGLKSINIPKSVTKIGSQVFYLCSSITSLTVESDADFSKSDLQFSKDGIYYTVLSKNTVEVANIFYKSNANLYKGDVVIPEKINPGSEFTVVGIAVRAFKSSEGLTSVTIPNSVKSIGANAFEGCKNMTSVTIPSSVTTIGQSAFYGCSGLTSFTIPQGVTDIYSGTFVNCTGLKSVTIHKSVTSIYSEAFKGCNNIETLTYNTDAIGTCFSGKTKLKTVNIGSSVTSIAQNAFSGCTGLTSITIPDNVTAIGDDAFKNCSGLTSLTIPDGVTTIGGSAFRGCSGLKSVTIPESVTSIGYWAFDGCNSIETLTYNTNAIGSHYSRGSHFCSNASLKTVNIGNSVNSIVSGAFQHCTGLTSLTIPNSVENIGSYAFYNCTGLKSITISDSLKTLESNAFENCSALTTIVIPKSTATVGGDVFKGCSNLTIYCEAESKPEDWADRWNPDNRPVIWGGNADAYTDDFTFEIIDEESLTAKITGYTGTNPNVIIPQKAKINGKDYSVTTIGSRVFDSNSILRSVFIPYTISNVESFAFGKNHYEAIICCEAAGDENTVPDGWASNWYGISVPAIAYNTHLDNGFVYRITDNSARNAQIIRYMGENDTVAVPEKINGGTYTVNSIAGYTFYECKAMKAIDIPSSVTEIGNYAFYGSSNIELLTYNTNAIGSNFQNSQSLKKVVIGNNVTKIDTWTFSHTGLEEVTFSASVKTVGSSAFSGCSKLKKADFASIESLCGIDFDIYESNPMEITHSLCVNGEEIVDAYIPNTVSSIGSHTFSGCSNLTSIAIPKSVTNIGENAFQNCSSLTIFCEAESQPEGWNEKWNPDNRPVVWGLYTDKKIWQATITPNNSEYGSVEGSGYLIDSTETTITATPAQGYHFTSWSDNNIDNPRVIKATSDTLLTAMFEAHTIVVDSAVAATCTESGLTEGSHCSVCGDTLIAQKTVSAKGHTSVTDAAVAATCTEPGLAEGSHCSVCGTVIVKQDTIPAKGHTIVVDKEVEPTCTKTGLGEGSHCSVCNEVIVAQTTIAAIGHEFVNYIYNNDATTTADGTETAVCERGCGATDTRVKEGTKLATAVTESAAIAVNIYAHGNTIVVENATEDIFVYNAMGALVCRDVASRVRAEININGTGIYIVKTGNTVKRVMVN
ncbi:MAG: leucine-rich repeat domain-containing protein [Salinivirgaceae bacterium]|nr:leucine-rich repeat domain-containing protein [Salinivirgaceae bacterium]